MAVGRLIPQASTYFVTMLQTSKPSFPPRAEAPMRPSRLPFVEFVTLMALMTALTAMSIDIMLPALPQIGSDLGLSAENQRQLVVTFYMMGFAPGQFIFGPLSDRYGRRIPLFIGLALYACGSAIALIAPTASIFLAARLLQGLGAAAPRVMAMSIVRDLYAGRGMARVMSFVMMVFIAVPILAPSAGQGVAHFWGWRSIFTGLFLVAVATLIWSAIRLPETKDPAERMPLSVAGLTHSLSVFISSRQSVGYTVALGFAFGTLLSYVNSAEQIFVDVYHLGGLFPVAFGGIASLMIFSSLSNAVLVRRLGMRRVSQAALLAFVCVCAIAALAGFPTKPPLLLFCAFIAMTFFCFGLMAPNFNALALEQVGPIAGMASAIFGAYSTAVGAAFGWLIGQFFDGTVRPLMIGFTLLALAALATVLLTERFRLFTLGAQPAEAREA
jgi:DHA1 family bicyclomycin/chloramphenicol resistance-like MFS transporter